VPTLYRNVLLLECADAAALAEALASLPERVVVWRLSATIVALDPEAAEQVVALLQRAGLTPRVLDA
jgi:hypothetical protein